MTTHFQHAILKEGSNSYLVKIIKEFLNMDFRTPYHLQINNSFDNQTKEALLYYQKTRNLRQTGVTDIHTWRSIGKELDPIKHNILTSSNPTLEFLLNKKRWKPKVHDEIIAKAFYGLKKKNIRLIQDGSRNVDMKYGIFPSTLLVKNAHMHSMRKPNQSIDNAIDESNAYIHKKLDEAKKKQNFYLKIFNGLSRFC